MKKSLCEFALWFSFLQTLLYRLFSYSFALFFLFFIAMFDSNAALLSNNVVYVRYLRAGQPKAYSITFFLLLPGTKYKHVLIFTYFLY